MKTGTQLIEEERQRQILQEGWTPAHDDEHDDSELAKAAASYALVSTVGSSYGKENPNKGWPKMTIGNGCLLWWPWDMSWWKPSEDPVRNLVKAGALIAAEIDRLQRLSEATPATPATNAEKVEAMRIRAMPPRKETP